MCPPTGRNCWNKANFLAIRAKWLKQNISFYQIFYQCWEMTYARFWPENVSSYWVSLIGPILTVCNSRAFSPFSTLSRHFSSLRNILRALHAQFNFLFSNIVITPLMFLFAPRKEYQKWQKVGSQYFIMLKL